MVKKVKLQTVLFATIISCGCVQAQKESAINRNDSILFCNKCDSLYNGMWTNEEKYRVFGGPEVFPQFQGGDKALMKFITNNLRYPDECKEGSIQGRVIIKFIIDESGKVICPRIIKYLHPAADEEALRIIKIMPNWKPALNGGIPCKMCYSLPIYFKK